jgi:hypothetical protein
MGTTARQKDLDHIFCGRLLPLFPTATRLGTQHILQTDSHEAQDTRLKKGATPQGELMKG